MVHALGGYEGHADDQHIKLVRSHPEWLGRARSCDLPTTDSTSRDHGGRAGESPSYLCHGVCPVEAEATEVLRASIRLPARRHPACDRVPVSNYCGAIALVSGGYR